MRKNRFGRLQLAVVAAVIIGLWMLSACANMGTPEGGPYDVTPPRLLKATPAMGSTKQTGNKISLLFDEAIQILKQNETVIVSPPQIKQPKISVYGRMLTIELRDNLRDSTTYTIDFTNGLADNNEGNILENFCYAFSTGDVLDSMQIGGRVIDALTLEPVAGVLVGIHDSEADTAFTKTPFLRTTLTGEDGSFTLKNLHDGRYKVFALQDADRDYAYSQLSEGVAFSPDWYRTEVADDQHNDDNTKQTHPDWYRTEVADDPFPSDTLLANADTLMPVDSAMAEKGKTSTLQETPAESAAANTSFRQQPVRYRPDNVLLRFYTSDFRREYLSKKSRPDSVQVSLLFNTRPDTIPALHLLGEQKGKNWYSAIRKGEKEIVYWLTDKEIYSRDTLAFSVTYPKSDSLNIPRPQTDTLRMAKPKVSVQRRPKGEAAASAPLMNISIKNSSSIASGTPGDTISIIASQPLALVDTAGVSVARQADSLWRDVPFKLRPDSLNPLKFFVDAGWQMGQSYRVRIDSAVWRSVYDRWNAPVEQVFSFLPEEDLSSLLLKLSGEADSTAVVELLNKGGEPVATKKAERGEVLFPYLKPDVYYARLFLDENGNGRWDAGNYPTKQPEWVFYYRQSFTLRKNWQQAEDWVVTREQYADQKPEAIRKVKPAEKQKRDLNREYEERMARRSKKKSKK
ncbi:Ig-like protein [Porphyromonas gingivalis]|uniref:Ig-like domain-containing protein n=1 Tax=Porphyromonas gingivalis TaxID=837 RepID=UPI000C1815B5|nr:Ig-like domain-containing protein [Porphyromonas gingivalis]ATR90702.1 Ig-like protein [Porphyromonas gingivalis]